MFCQGPMPIIQPGACTKEGISSVMMKTILVNCGSPTPSGDSTPTSDTPAHMTLDMAQHPGDSLLQPAPVAVPGITKTASQPATTKAAASATAGSVELLDVQPLCAPDPSEGPEAAAEYEAYLKRWEEGDTLAQRWARLKAKGRANVIQQEWEDMELDLMLQQHCSNTPAAKAARGAATATAAGMRAHPALQGRRGARRSRAEIDAEAAAQAAAAAGVDELSGGRKTRSRHAPKTLQDFHVDMPVSKKVRGSSDPEVSWSSDLASDSDKPSRSHSSQQEPCADSGAASEDLDAVASQQHELAWRQPAQAPRGVAAAGPNGSVPHGSTGVSWPAGPAGLLHQPTASMTARRAGANPPAAAQHGVPGHSAANNPGLLAVAWHLIRELSPVFAHDHDSLEMLAAYSKTFTPAMYLALLQGLKSQSAAIATAPPAERQNILHSLEMKLRVLQMMQEQQQLQQR